MAKSRSQLTNWMVRRLRAADAAVYQALRLEGFTLHPLQFRVAPEDEAELSLDTVGERLERAFVTGGFDAGGLAGVGGLTRFEGAKLQHKGLLWGMYLREHARGSGLARQLVGVLLAEARIQGIEQVILTVAAENRRAQRLYEGSGFTVYGIEPRSIKVGQVYLAETLMVCRVN